MEGWEGELVLAGWLVFRQGFAMSYKCSAFLNCCTSRLPACLVNTGEGPSASGICLELWSKQ